MVLLHSLIARRWIGCQNPWWPWPKAIHFSWLGSELSSVAWSTGAQLIDLLLLQISSGVVWQTRELHLSCNSLYLLSPSLYFFIVINLYLFVNHEDLLTSLRIITRTEQSTKCLYHISYRGWGCRRKTSLSPPVIHYWPFQGGGSNVVLVACFGVRV